MIAKSQNLISNEIVPDGNFLIRNFLNKSRTMILAKLDQDQVIQFFFLNLNVII